MFAWFDNQPVKVKLTLAFGLGGSVTVGIVALCLVNTIQLRDNFSRVQATQFQPLMTLTQVRSLAHQSRTNTVTAALTKSTEERDATIARVQDLSRQIDETMALLLPAIQAEDLRTAADQFVRADRDYRAFRDHTIFTQAKAGDQAAALAALKGEGTVKFNVSMEALNTVIETKSHIASTAYDASQGTGRDGALLLLLVAAFGIGLGCLVSWRLANGLSRNLHAITAATQALGNGDMTARAPMTNHDDIGLLAQALNDMGAAFEKTDAKQAEMVGALDAANAAVTMIDRHFNITYVNQGALKQFKTIEPILRTLFPGFDSDKLVGTCIDRFHKDPLRIRHLLDDPRNLPYKADIQAGPLTLELSVSAITDKKGAYLGNTLEWRNVTDSRKQELETSRLRAGLDNATVNVIVCDRDFQIVYLNKASQDKLRATEPEIQKVMPTFRADKLLGSCIDQYHKNAALQRQLLDNPKNLPYRSEIQIGPLTLDLSVSAIMSDKGEYLGNVLEWMDVTAQKKVNREVERLIQAAAAGQLDERIEVAGFQGAHHVLAAGMNKLLAAVAKPLDEAQQVLTALSQGDLRTQMTGAYEGKFDQMKASLNAAITNLTAMLTTVKTAAESVSNGSEEITMGNEDLSQRTSEQASSLEETSSAMEQMTSTVKQNADNAKQANQLAIAARDVAENGGSVTAKAIDAMDEINKSSKKIADIITVIDEIAFQTNLLALNAAVEAARAGEHGRGFAVVAAEVRNLAQRSATAAKEIKGLINESVQRVTDGSQLVDQSGKTLTEIVGSVKRVTDIIAEISAASQEQASGIDQVNKAIMEMDQTTQQNAALVEEATSASQSMKEQAQELMRQVSSFQLAQTGTQSQSVSTQATARPKGPSSGSPAQPLFKRPAAAPRTTASLKPASIASGNGKEHRHKDMEFEEF